MKRIRPFYAVAAVIVALALLLPGCFVYLLGIRTEYKQVCVEINGAILAQPPETCTVEQNGQVWQADGALLDRYDAFLLLPHVWPLRREQVSPTARSIMLHVGGDTLTLTELDNRDVNLLWQTGTGSRGFTFHAGPAAFAQLESYLNTAAKKP